MNRLALSLLLLLQINSLPMGVITGVVRNSDGKPVSELRVYAIAVPDSGVDIQGLTALESVTQTDSSGRYRLEVIPGRYIVGAGAVTEPTFHPGTTNPSSAQIVSVTSKAVVSAIDVSGIFGAATTSALSLINLPPGSTGVLAGTLRAKDGKALAGITVTLTPKFAATSEQVRSTRLTAFTDRNGRYRFDRLWPDTYILSAGFADAPTFYPGTADRSGAMSIKTDPTTNLGNLDFEAVRTRESLDKYSVRGRVTITPRPEYWDAYVTIRRRSPLPSTANLDLGLPAGSISVSARVYPDGTFALVGLNPGTYFLQVISPGVRAEPTTVVIEDMSISDLALAVSAN